MGRCAMGLHARIWFTAAQKAELWERWKNGQSAAAISRALERRNKTGVERIVVLHGGIAPAPRRRALAALRAIVQTRPIGVPGSERCALSHVVWRCIGSYDGAWRRSSRCNGRRNRSPAG